MVLTVSDIQEDIGKDKSVDVIRDNTLIKVIPNKKQIMTLGLCNIVNVEKLRVILN